MKKDKKAKHREGKGFSWLVPGIRVKIVSRKYREGKYYLSSGIVTDILSEKDFLFVTDSKECLDDLKEKHLETEIPKIGGAVRILRGEHQGQLGILHSRDKTNNRVEVRLDDANIIAQLSQDDCSAVQF